MKHQSCEEESRCMNQTEMTFCSRGANSLGALEQIIQVGRVHRSLPRRRG
jgi:hypothetical protein